MTTATAARGLPRLRRQRDVLVCACVRARDSEGAGSMSNWSSGAAWRTRLGPGQARQRGAHGLAHPLLIRNPPAGNPLCPQAFLDPGDPHHVHV